VLNFWQKGKVDKMRLNSVQEIGCDTLIENIKSISSDKFPRPSVPLAGGEIADYYNDVLYAAFVHSSEIVTKKAVKEDIKSVEYPWPIGYAPPALSGFVAGRIMIGTLDFLGTAF